MSWRCFAYQITVAQLSNHDGLFMQFHSKVGSQDFFDITQQWRLIAGINAAWKFRILFFDINCMLAYFLVCSYRACFSFHLIILTQSGSLVEVNGNTLDRAL